MSEIISILAIVVSAISALYAIKANQKSTSHKFTYDVLIKLFDDDDIRCAYNCIDYDDEWYNEKFHNPDSEIQKQVDKMLGTLNFVVMLHNQKQMSDKEFELFDYKFSRVLKDEQIQYYLWNLTNFANSFSEKCSFDVLINYMLEKNCDLKTKFSSIDFAKRYLNFEEIRKYE